MSMEPKSRLSFPPGLTNAFWFATFNAFSFQVVLGSPMVLYARSLNAGATVLGLIAGMMPLLVIFQIFAAPHVGRIGYKRFVYGGWSVRVMFIGFMALIPLLGPHLDAATRLSLILALLFAFNLSRGITSCGWLPWITLLVPAEIRGRYLTVEAAFVNLASFAVFLVSAFALGTEPAEWRFTALFAFSAAMGAVSLAFLKRIPDVEAPREERESREPVPWGAISGHPPFRKLLLFSVAWSFAFGGILVFTVAFLKGVGGFSERDILLITSASFVGGLSSLVLLGNRLDRLGSKPALVFAQIVCLLVLGGWTCVAGGILRPSVVLVLALTLMAGLSGAVVQMCNTRLMMAIAPPLARSHFFALFSVVSNVSLGVAPMFWGLLIDLCKPLHVHWAGAEWNGYSVYFASALGVLVISIVLCRRLDEPQAAGTEILLREILIESPQRLILRLWNR